MGNAPESSSADREANLKKLDEAYIRWQKIRIDQLGFVNNLLIGLAAAIMALEATGALGKMSEVPSDTKRWLLYSFILLMVSLTFGIVVTLTRLYDIRYTARIVRRRKYLFEINESEKNDHEISQLRQQTDRLGKSSWVLLWLQIVPFFLGTLVLLCAVYRALV
jgi:hypothetical protein